MKLLVCGGRDYRNERHVGEIIYAAVMHGGCTEVICGFDPEDDRYQGADQLAYEQAAIIGVPCRTFPADWKRFGRSAGPRRNAQMAADLPDECAAFTRSNGDWGAGTLNMIEQARRAGAVIHMLPRENHQ